MSRSAVVAVVVAVVVLGGGGALLVAHNHSNSNKTGTAGDKNLTATPIKTSKDRVSITNFSFSPANITVKKGATVVWTNKDSAAHTVTEMDDQSGPDSTNLANGKSYSFTYNTVGTFKYHCSIHPDMTGTVTVTE